ncbi:MarC family protein [Candidatus Micrarchaeota archaeon]|nr:MarC family protein [Candidatus Micrarchaeota archaeon]
MVELALEPIVTSLIALLIIMDPFSSIPAFLGLTKKMDGKQKADAALTAALVAGGVTVGFALAGMELLAVLGVRLHSFQVAGGLLLLLAAIQFAFGIKFGEKEGKSKASLAIVLIGVPLIAGPGTMTTAVLLAGTHGIVVVVVAALIATAVAYIILRASSAIGRLLGARGLEISSRLMGILLAAIGVEYIRLGFGF